MKNSIRVTMGMSEQNNLQSNPIQDLNVEKQKLITKENQIMGLNQNAQYQTNESQQSLMHQNRVQMNIDGQSEKTSHSGSTRGGKKKKKKRPKQQQVQAEVIPADR